MAQSKGILKPRHSRHISRAAVTSDTSGRNRNQAGRQFEQSSNEATVAYIKRVLCQKPTKPDGSLDTTAGDIKDKPLDELLPPLTSSNEIDIQLYALISIILNLFVQSWYNRITPDADFVAEVVQIIAHCTRGLEERIRHVDLESLLLDEIPDILHEHLRSVESAREASQTHYGTDAAAQVGAIYHGLNPHMALSPVPCDLATSLAQQENETAWSQLLISGLLPLILPPEDLENPCLRVLVAEIFSEMIFHKAILGKTAEPWLLWESLTKIAHILHASGKQSDSTAVPGSTRLESLGLLPSKAAKTPVQAAPRNAIEVSSRMFWLVVHSIALLWLFLRWFLTALMQASSLPPRLVYMTKLDVAELHPMEHENGETQPIRHDGFESRAIVSMGVWACTCHLLSLDRRMPWLSGLLSLIQWLSLFGPGRVCGTNSALDRLLSAQINEHLINPALVAPALRAIRTAVFPDNALPPPREPPTPEQVLRIKHACARAIVDAIPTAVRTRFFATTDQHAAINEVEQTLDLFADDYINKHLIVGLIEYTVTRLFPELADRSPTF